MGQVFVKLALFFLLATIGLNAYAQTIRGSDQRWTGKETKEDTWRKKIDIDMSIPDFKTKKIDQNVMGWRLGKMMAFVQDTYMQAQYNRALSYIRYEQTEDPQIRFETIDKLDFVNAEKKDSVILIKWHTMTKFGNKEKIEHDISFKIVNGITDSERINEFLSDIGRYIKPGEEENE